MKKLMILIFFLLLSLVACKTEMYTAPVLTLDSVIAMNGEKFQTACVANEDYTETCFSGSSVIGLKLGDTVAMVKITTDNWLVLRMTQEQAMEYFDAYRQAQR